MRAATKLEASLTRPAASLSSPTQFRRSDDRGTDVADVTDFAGAHYLKA